MPAPTCTIVVAYQFGQTGHAALSRAVALASRSPGHVLHVVCVLEAGHPIPSIPADAGVDHRYLARVEQVMGAVVQAELDVASPPHPVLFQLHTRIGKPADQILALAREVTAELIVVGHHQVTGIERYLVGSVSEAIARDALCSVETARVAPVPSTR